MLGRIVCRDPLSKHRTGSGICGAIHLLQLLERNTADLDSVYSHWLGFKTAKAELLPPGCW